MITNIFLGGTCNNSEWRNDLIPKLDKINIKYFNPVVDNWDDNAYKNELNYKYNICDSYLFVITPKMTGAYSIHEVTYLTLKYPNKPLFFAVIPEKDNDKFSKGQIKSFDNIAKDLKEEKNFHYLNDNFYYSDYKFCLQSIADSIKNFNININKK